MWRETLKYDSDTPQAGSHTANTALGASAANTARDHQYQLQHRRIDTRAASTSPAVARASVHMQDAYGHMKIDPQRPSLTFAYLCAPDDTRYGTHSLFHNSLRCDPCPSYTLLRDGVRHGPCAPC